MSAHLINGNILSQKLRSDIAKRAAILTTKGQQPGLAVILIGNNPASQLYVHNKVIACKKNGIYSKLELYDSTLTETELNFHIYNLNNNPKIHGILIQLPLPTHINSQKIIQTISEEKDVDGFHINNIGLMTTNNPRFIPCTPRGIIKMLQSINYSICGAHAVIVGASNIVGKPLATLLLQFGATVTICNSKTKNLKHYTRQADVLIAAIGKPNIITVDMIKSGSVIIDVGINRDNTGKLCGDVDFIRVKEIANYITPTPGGVGPMTITMLMLNTIEAAERASILL